MKFWHVFVYCQVAMLGCVWAFGDNWFRPALVLIALGFIVDQAVKSAAKQNRA